MIQRLDPIYADFTIPENNLSGAARDGARSAAGYACRRKRIDAARAHLLDSAVPDGSGTVDYAPRWKTWTGASGPGASQVRLVLDTLRAAVLVPASAVSADGSFVYVAKPDSTAELRPVRLGQRQDERIVVAQGLTG